jgi:hypothetical protein
VPALLVRPESDFAIPLPENANTGGSGASAADLEARTELELRHAGARSTSEPGLSRVHTHLGTRKYPMPRRWSGWGKPSGGSVGGNRTSSSAPASAAETITRDPGNDGRACATGDAANQGASVSRTDKVSHKIVSLFEPHTESIRKGKASKPNEFGKLVQAPGSREPDQHAL